MKTIIKNKKKKRYKKIPWLTFSALCAFYPMIILVVTIVVFYTVVGYLINPSGSSVGTSKNNRGVSSWDGSVACVESYLKSSLHDPSSYKSYKWSTVEKNADGTFKVAHEYGAKNGFGAMRRSTYWFTYNSSGKVIPMAPGHFKE